MRTNRLFETPVNELFSSSIHAQPVQVEGWDAIHGYDEDGESEVNFWEVVRYDVPTPDGLGIEALLVVNSNTVMATEDTNGNVVYLSGSHDDNRESYIEDNCNDHGDPIEGTLAETTLERIDSLQDVSEHASGPQMNYWYPVDHITDESEAIAAALAIRDLNLCVVEVNGAFGLALTGGGMDLSWDICAAYLALGHLPPIHFSDLPRMAGEKGNAYVWQGMYRALTIASEQARRQRDRLSELFPQFTPPEVN